MKKLVIEVEVAGQTAYLTDRPSIFSKCYTTEVIEAKDYSEDQYNLTRHLNELVLPTDEIYARSGLRVTACSIVEVEVEVKVSEQSRRIGRAPSKMYV